MHAVSVGEITSAVPLVRRLRAEQPGIPVFLSTSTVAGRKTAERHAAFLVDGIFYSPLDFVNCVRRTLRTIHPALLIVFETEIWPNLYSETTRAGARLAIVNGRISNRAWRRYRFWRFLFTPILKLPDLISAQSEVDRQRFLQLGADPDKLGVGTNLKYDAIPEFAPPELPDFEAARVWIAASTVGPNERGAAVKHNIDEDDLVLSAFAGLAEEFPRLLLILAPRQPSRFDLVAAKIRRRQIPFVRRSELKKLSSQPLQLPGVLLLDTIGELATLYSSADVVFVGGSLAPRGGHNIIEPAAARAPIIVGPHMQNFETIVQDFRSSDALIQIERTEELMDAVRDLLNHRQRAIELGNNARHVVEANRGASQALAAQLLPLYFSAVFKPCHSAIVRACLRPLAWLWKEGGLLKRYQGERYAGFRLPLPAPIVSVGGITVGGAGKTPFTTYAAKRLKDYGYVPAILTRGYRRRSPAPNLIFPPGAKVPSGLTGDEAQIFLRRSVAPVGIGADRYQTARILLRQHPDTSILLLDDGFQHAMVPRDFDVVVIDGLDPFGENELVPLGRLREPLSALARADAFVVTRAENETRFHEIARGLQKYNASAPVFRTKLVAGSWRDSRSGASLPDLARRRVGAFCALGNPDNFWQTLSALDLQVVFCWAFEDHHVYKPFELQRIAHQARLHGAEILVTTEKDRINCPGQLVDAIAPFELAWLEIELQLQDEATFFEFLKQTLRKRRVAPVAS